MKNERRHRMVRDAVKDAHHMRPRSKAVVFGASSIVGWSFVCQRPAFTAFCNRHTRLPPGLDWRRINLQEADAVQRLLREEPPELVIHCAGVCDVAKCEESPDFAHLVNVRSMEILLEHLPAATRVVYLSSDHVFSGEGGPYVESTPPDPISVYGRTRARAEAILLSQRPDALVIRAGLWIGPSYNGRLGHLDWLRSRHQRGLPMTVIADEVRSAVWAEDAVARVLALEAAGISGIRHVTAARAVSRPTLAHYLNRRFAIGAHFTVRTRNELTRPHLGRLELQSELDDPLAAPLPSVVPAAFESLDPA